MSEVASPSPWAMQPWPEFVAWLTLRTAGGESLDVGARVLVTPDGPAADEERR